MDTVEISLSVPSIDHDQFIGWLESAATGFQQTDSELTAYVPADDWSEPLREKLDARLRAGGYDDAMSLRLIADRNWNEVWESTITPVRVGPFLICRTSVEVPDEHADATVLHIDPRQSFGTGHHGSTRLALRLVTDSVTDGDRVLDIGIGTGVLAIAACHLGAESVLGVDTDRDATNNARENIAQNNVSDRVTVREGSVSVIPADTEADVIAANITLDTILNLLPALRTRLAPDGDLVLSGLLTSQKSRMLEGLDDNNLTPVQDVRENGWWAVRCRPDQHDDHTGE